MDNKPIPHFCRIGWIFIYKFLELLLPILILNKIKKWLRKTKTLQIVRFNKNGVYAYA